MADSRAFYLQELALVSPRTSAIRFRAMLLASCGILLLLGFQLARVPFSTERPIDQARKLKMAITFEAEKKKAESMPMVKKKALDLTQAPELKADRNTVVKKVNRETVRSVYGLRRVLATGLGVGGSGSEAIVSKLGNTLDKPTDTLTATEAEIKGEVASVSTVTTKPVPLETFKPEYTDEMKRNRVKGVISARVLVDIDGKVKRVEVLNDLGFGTREAAETACFKLVFKPAMEGDEPVAVWIVFKFRFVLQED